MKTFLKILIWLSFLLIVMTSVFFWFESTKEVRVLCQYFRPGQTQESVIRTLNTGNLLHYRIRPTESNSTTLIEVTTPYNLGTSQCRIKLSESSSVQTSDYLQFFHLERLVAVVGSIGLVGILAFQLLLVFGWISGRWAFGGPYRILPVTMRGAIGLSAILSMYGIIVLFEGAQLLSWIQDPEVISYSLGAYFLLFVFGTFILILSPIKGQRKLMIPLITLLSICFWTVGVASW